MLHSRSYRALLALHVCRDEVTLSPGSHHVVLHFASRGHAKTVWVVPECEGVSRLDTMHAVRLPFPCHSHTHVDNFLWAWGVLPAWGFGLGGGGGSPVVDGVGSPAVAGEAASSPKSPPLSPEHCSGTAGIGQV